jgi:hypothetical protein
VPTPLPRAVWLDLAACLDPAGLYQDGRAERPGRDWLALFRLATAQLVAPALYVTLARRDRLASVPAAIRDALEGLYRLNDQRNRCLRAVLHETVRALNRAGIVPVLLKGAIALLPDQYPQSEARMLGDLDLAMTPPEVPLAAAALEAAGFFPAPTVDSALFQALWERGELAHWLPLIHPAGDVTIELHRDLFHASRLRAALPLPQVLAAARETDWDGLRVKLPALADRLLHNALHHQVQDRAFDSDRRSLRQLLEFAHLRALPAAADLDWPGLLRPLDRAGVGSAVRAYLLAAQWLFGQPLPAGVTPTPAARRAEARFRFRLDHPRLAWLPELRWQGRRWASRLSYLPRRLLTPAWYPVKYRLLRQRWLPS